MDRNLRGRVCVRGGRGGQRRQRTVISDEIRATVIDHVLVHGMSMREAGQRVQPNISRFTVSTIIRRFQIFKIFCKPWNLPVVTWRHAKPIRHARGAERQGGLGRRPPPGPGL
ncbi:hypothetical protein N1851_027006 [Merluccius polli]|uniref:Uncharacterized protein n=1 Tax=Merluccius polli TaxID=89951 RepID=A0AA47NTR5_MERPO|nr:hypothetical protein N1851_027006 [Merluccius polli]